MKDDLRAQLKAIAAGKGKAPAGTRLIDQALVEREQRAFAAWGKFCAPTDGEPITTPQGLLTPLP